MLNGTTQRGRSPGGRDAFVSDRVVVNSPIKQIRPQMIAIVSLFLLNVKYDQGKCGHSNCQASKIEQTGRRSFPELTESKEHRIHDHREAGIAERFYCLEKCARL